VTRRASDTLGSAVLFGVAVLAAAWTALAALLALVNRFFIRLGGTPDPHQVERVDGLYAIIVTMLVATIGIGAGRRLARTTEIAPRLANVGRWCVGVSAVAGLIAVADGAFHIVPMYLQTGGNP